MRVWLCILSLVCRCVVMFGRCPDRKGFFAGVLLMMIVAVAIWLLALQMSMLSQLRTFGAHYNAGCSFIRAWRFDRLMRTGWVIVSIGIRGRKGLIWCGPVFALHRFSNIINCSKDNFYLHHLLYPFTPTLMTPDLSLVSVRHLPLYLLIFSGLGDLFLDL